MFSLSPLFLLPFSLLSFCFYLHPILSGGTFMSNLTGGPQSSTNIQQRFIEPFNLPDTVLESLVPDKKHSGRHVNYLCLFWIFVSFSDWLSFVRDWTLVRSYSGNLWVTATAAVLPWISNNCVVQKRKKKWQETKLACPQSCNYIRDNLDFRDVINHNTSLNGLSCKPHGFVELRNWR